ncbi:MAG: hypothetical protein GOMPHAMPRED_001121 [Gomphillus americanus]|uniref:60S ribosomal subunit assembly/export protein LOC1 n=1 Tax=Gomphillus americanus TaxID=1940652 RepID=A0A8H3F3D3_9LECA|nr:MAG: hypothetical protein GOMPHAMPRED_001121 [Gomphillus americanus]
MAPSRSPRKTKPSSSNKSTSKRSTLQSSSKTRISKSKVQNAAPSKTKRPTISTKNKKKKQRTYTEKELGIPQLNMITPVGVQKPRGKKKGKVFVDDAESMMTILALVNAEKEGQIESKMVRARQMEEIREARRKEQEKREMARKEKLEEVKDGLRKKRLKNLKILVDVKEVGVEKKVKKKVSFG